MRPTHKNRSRNRHRSGGSSGGGGGNPLSRVYESNGPDVKVRGTAQTVADKYLQLGRDAQSSGDNVMAESYFQHAEHYLRIVFAAQAYNQQNQQQYRRPDEDFDEDDLEDQQDAASEQRGGAQQAGEPDGLGDQPAMEGGPERSQQQQSRPPREQRDYGRDNRDQGQSRDRYRPRWQDRRNESQQAQPQPRAEDQPQPAAADPGSWEAPSFLRRPAPAAPAGAEGGVAEEASPDQPAAKRRYERRPRKEAAETSSDGE